MENQRVRQSCLVIGKLCEQPTPDEVREVLRLSGFSGSQAASYLGLGQGGGRTIRRWTGGDAKIPYASWALLCHAAGFGEIWKSED